MGKYILGCLGLLIVGVIILAIIVGASWADRLQQARQAIAGRRLKLG